MTDLSFPRSLPESQKHCTCVGVTMGGYENQETVPIPPHMEGHRAARLAAGLSDTLSIDRCVLPAIQELWALGIRTTGSCCGHGLQPGMINVHDGDQERMLALGYRREAGHPNAFVWPQSAKDTTERQPSPRDENQ